MSVGFNAKGYWKSKMIYQSYNSCLWKLFVVWIWTWIWKWILDWYVEQSKCNQTVSMRVTFQLNLVGFCACLKQQGHTNGHSFTINPWNGWDILAWRMTKLPCTCCKMRSEFLITSLRRIHFHWLICRNPWSLNSWPFRVPKVGSLICTKKKRPTTITREAALHTSE
jgi:hypothetical protein